MIQRRNYLLGLLFVVFGAVGFASKSIFIKLVYDHENPVDPITLMALRMGLALPVFLIVALAISASKHSQPMAKNNIGYLFLLGFLGYYLASLLDLSGLQYISAGLERVILYIYPTFVVWILFAFGMCRFNKMLLLASIICYIGLALVFVAEVRLLSVDDLLLGGGLVAASALVFAFFTVGSEVMIKRIGPHRFTGYSMTIACLITLIHFFIVHELKDLFVTQDVLNLAILLAIFSTVLPAFAMGYGIKKIGSAHASVLSSFGPIVTIGLAYIFLQEPISAMQIVGTAVVMMGVVVLVKNKREH